MKKLIALLILGTIFISCTPEGQIFNENQELSPEVEWLKKDSRKFKVPVDNNSPNYEMIIAFRYADGFPYKEAKIKVTETSPSGKEEVYEYDLKVRDDNGDYIGEGSLDIWDSEHVVEKSKKFEETGNYKYVIEHNMPQDPMVFAMEIGMIFNKAK